MGTISFQDCQHTGPPRPLYMVAVMRKLEGKLDDRQTQVMTWHLVRRGLASRAEFNPNTRLESQLFLQTHSSPERVLDLGTAENVSTGNSQFREPKYLCFHITVCYL